MKNLFPAASACLVVVFIASVGYAENKTDQNKAAPKTETNKEKTELTVAPWDHVVYPEDRPDWVSQEPNLESDVHTWIVTTSACEQLEDCQSELEVLLQANVALYIKERTGWICDDQMFNNGWIENELEGRRYEGTLVRGDQTLHEIAVELRFDETAREKIRDAWRNAAVAERLGAAGFLLGLGFVGLCCTGGLLSVVSRRYT